MQTLFLQVLLPLHSMPQPPQFALSVAVSTQALVQRVSPGLQVTPQPLGVQVAVPFATVGQTVPHAPQFFTSDFTSVHCEPQRIVGCLHWKSQLPVHTGVALAGAVHTVPHLPQLEVSLETFTHDPLQLVCVPQSAVHFPVLHTVPGPQTVVQLPQCMLSDCRSIQLAPHAL